MRIAALFIALAAAPSFAEEPKVSFSLAPGVAWTIPLTRDLAAYNGLLQGTLPLFDVSQDIYPGLMSTRAIGVASIGLRLFL